MFVAARERRSNIVVVEQDSRVACVFTADSVDGRSDQEIIEEFRRAREASYGELGQEIEPEAEPVDIVAVLQALGEGGNGVLLTALREAADLPDTKAVRALLDEAGIRVRAGVRTPAGNGPGVHGSDIPTPSPTASHPSSERCLCSSGGTNANANNRPDIVQDPHNPHRWHVVKEPV